MCQVRSKIVTQSDFFVSTHPESRLLRSRETLCVPGGPGGWSPCRAVQSMSELSATLASRVDPMLPPSCRKRWLSSPLARCLLSGISFLINADDFGPTQRLAVARWVQERRAWPNFRLTVRGASSRMHT